MSGQHHKPRLKWRIIVESQTGASHRRRGTENQDAVVADCSSIGGSSIACAAVADGHGSAKSFRSRRGSALAVEIALDSLRSLANSADPTQSLSFVKDTATRSLPSSIVRRWREQVALDLQSDPISSAEWDKLEQDAGVEVREKLARQVQEVGTDWQVIYGATLLCVLITESFAFYLQLGDGEILILKEGDENARPAMSVEDPTLIANETTSLCLPDAHQRFRSEFHVLGSTSPPPRVVLLTTDGYPNSFQSRDGFLQVPSDLLALLKSEGEDVVRRDLPQWLEEASAQGSGDDVSLVLIYRDPADDAKTDQLPEALNTPDSDSDETLAESERPLQRSFFDRFTGIFTSKRNTQSDE